MLITRAPERNGIVRWQWKNTQKWMDYSVPACRKIEQEYQFGRAMRYFAPFTVWDDGTQREIDLKGMRQLPDRRKLRRIPPEAPKNSLSIGPQVGSTPRAGQLQSKALMQTKGRSRSAPHKASIARLARGKTAPSAQRGKDAEEDPDFERMLHRLVHPALAKMREVRFDFSPLNPRSKYLDEFAFIPEGPHRDLARLVDEYVYLLTEHWVLEGKMPVLPARGSPANVMAAISLALFAVESADVLPVSVQRRQEIFGSLHLGQLSPVPSVPSSRSNCGLFGSRSAPNLDRRPASAPAAGQRMNRPPSSVPQLSVPAGRAASKPIEGICFTTGPDTYEARTKAHEIKEAWREWRDVSVFIATKLDETPPQPLQEREDKRGGGPYHWIGSTNFQPCCFDRLDCAVQTLWHASALRSSSEILSNTKVLSMAAMRLRPQSAARFEATISRIAHTPTWEHAVAKADEGGSVALVILSSQFKVGGNFLTGLMHETEEEFCTCSSLYLHLREAARQARQMNLRSAGGYEVVIPEDGVVMSKDVVVFRQRSTTGYAPRARPAVLSGVFSMSWPCRSPGEREPGDTMLVGKLFKKLLVVLEGCNELKVDSLVISDEGASATKSKGFGVVFGKALYLATHSLARKPPEIIMGGSNAFYDNAVRSEWDRP